MKPDELERLRDDAGARQELSEQLVELQTQLAFQEDTLQALDAVVTRQQQQLDRLSELTGHLQRQFADLLGELEQQSPQQRPPHY
jgi:SlyX protein